MKFRPGTIVKSWATDVLKGPPRNGIVVGIKQEVEEYLPEWIEILWDDGELGGEFADELEIVEIKREKK